MECPFCAEEVKDAALVCRYCGRDLAIPKPLIEENRELTATIGRLRLEVKTLSAELARHKGPGAFWVTHLAVYTVPPILLLLAAHILLIVELDLNPLLMRTAAMLIPLPFGFALAWVAHLRWRMALTVGIIIGIVAVGGMTTIIGYVDNVPIMPQNAREWRETIEYAASIALATLTGNILATMVRSALPKHVTGSKHPSAMAMRIAMLMDPHAGSHALRRRSEKIQGLMKTAGSAVAAAGSASGAIYTGIRALLTVAS
jgi:hypothetical protein